MAKNGSEYLFPFQRVTNGMESGSRKVVVFNQARRCIWARGLQDLVDLVIGTSGHRTTSGHR